ncbi:hypothetical protein J7L06_07835 [Candidatus Bathyarchaeota archaeon]|nr:hypothetical protein [Candidatus Bathyarchaeota archaeon]
MKEEYLKGFSPSKALLPAAACLSSILAIHLYFISKIVSTGEFRYSLQMRFIILVLLTIYAMMASLAILEHYDAKHAYRKLMEIMHLLPDDAAAKKILADSILFPKTAFYLVYVGLTIFTAVYFCLATFILKFFITTELWILMILTAFSMTFMIAGFLSTEVVPLPVIHEYEERKEPPERRKAEKENSVKNDEKSSSGGDSKEKLFEAFEDKAEEKPKYDDALERLKKQRKIVTVRLEEDKEPTKEAEKDSGFDEESELLQSLRELQEILRDLKGKVKKTGENVK